MSPAQRFPWCRYPYKGFLDKAGNRCLANGTNAWTEVNNTTVSLRKTDSDCPSADSNDLPQYTTQTASEAGMLQLLPIYLDHIFEPTLTDAAFTTEVFHVDGHGHEGGVVYSEMQGIAGSSDEALELRMQQTLYNDKNGYRSETGGMLSALRHLKLDDSGLWEGADLIAR